MKRIAIIGGGISGLTVANLLRDQYEILVFEKESTPGGLIRCKTVNGSLFHICGGHVFNSKRQDVLDWFWEKFDRSSEFIQTDRNSVIDIEGTIIPYPLENHIYLLDQNIQKTIIREWLSLRFDAYAPANFEDFLKSRFGETLYNLYFKPYNEKIWRCPLQQVSLSWLEGKLPMPSVEEMFLNNLNQIKEKEFVHSTFWYERKGGSQFIADRLAKDIPIAYNTSIQHIERDNDSWIVDGQKFNMVIFCGNLKDLPATLSNMNLASYTTEIDKLESHGTTSVFCEIEKNPYSWIYLPSSRHSSHRIICTGNFSPANNSLGKMTATIEFTDEMTIEEILDNLSRIPFNPTYLTHHYNQYTYPIQDLNTRKMIAGLKKKLSADSFYLTGRFADWEYYNMDVAIGAAMDTCKLIRNRDSL